MTIRLHLALAFVALCFFGAGEADAYRVAIVIGNDDYVRVRDLNNAARDADLIGRTLGEIGFTDVRVLRNARKDEIARELVAFHQRAAGAEVAFIYFAGHGFAVGTRTATAMETGYTGFITGADWDGSSADGISIANALIASQAANRVVVVIDACRTYYQPRPGAPLTIVQNISTGLPWSLHGREPMRQDQVFFAASTWNEQPAYDGEQGANSVFGQVFAGLIRSHGAAQAGFGDQLVAEVSRRTSQDQVPFVISNLPTSGNPLIGAPRGAAPVVTSAQMTSATAVENASEAVFDSAGRALALSPNGIVDVSARPAMLRDTNGAIALADDGTSALHLRGTLISTRWLARQGARRTYRLNEAVTLGSVTRRGYYAAATVSNRILLSDDTFREFWFHPASGPIATLLLSNESGRLYYGTADGAICADGDYSDRERWCFQAPGPVRQIAEAPDGSMLMTLVALASPSVQLRSARSGALITQLFTPDGSFPSHADFSPDGRLAAIGTDGGGVSLWDPQSADLLYRIPARPGAIRNLRFSADSTNLVLTRANGSVEIWRLTRS